MFSLETLHLVREHELSVLVGYLKPGCSILEIGGGTGYQARELSSRGFRVETIDLASSSHGKSRIYPITEYDGRSIPFGDQAFDVVLSSNVLEHVQDLPAVFRETRRVLRPGGYCVHALPSPSWRLWTSAAGPLDTPAFLLDTARKLALGSEETGRVGLRFAKGLVARFAPIPHGARGTAVSELRRFGRTSWTKEFERNGFEVVSVAPMHLFYTGWSLLGSRLPLASREALSRLLGSSCYVYKVEPR